MILKTLALGFVLAGVAQAKAVSADVLYIPDAVIHFPDPKAFGGHTTIEFDGDSYLLATIGKGAAEAVDQLRGNHQFHKQSKTMAGKVVGFIVKDEKGHFPNPTAKFDVFYLSETSIPSPRGLPPKK